MSNKFDQPRFEIFQIDAFTDTLFNGNPAAVVPLENWLEDDSMQKIAAENNLAETAFYIPEKTGFSIRWFTPSKEVDLCGHATLAAAHVLYEFRNYDHPVCVFKTKSRGNLEVQRFGKGYSMDFPADTIGLVGPKEKATIAGMIGEEPRDCIIGTDDYLVILKDEQSVRKFIPNFAAIKKLNARGLIISAAADSDFDFISRCFFPKYGIDEDPVTGSAHTLLAPYWGTKLGKNDLVGLQASERTGIVSCKIHGDRVDLRGSAITYLKGEIFL